MKDKKIEIPLYDAEGLLQDYLKSLAGKDICLADRLKTFGLPSEGDCRLTTTPGHLLVHSLTYKDFTIKSLSVLLGKQDDVETDKLRGILHLSGPQVWRVWRVWLMDINRGDSESFIRYMWNDLANGAVVTIENINNDLYEARERNGNASDVIIQLRRLLPGLKMIELAEAKRGRPEGTGWFKSVKDFRTAVKDVLSTHRNRPTQLQTLRLLDEHPLCQLKPQKPRDQSHTKLLRDWIHNARLTSYEETLRRYRKSAKSGK